MAARSGKQCQQTGGNQLFFHRFCFLLINRRAFARRPAEKAVRRPPRLSVSGTPIAGRLYDRHLCKKPSKRPPPNS
jgi:hypothetical protein